MFAMNDKHRSMRETVLRILKFFLFVFVYAVLGVPLMTIAGIPNWAYFLIIPPAFFAWDLWSDRKRRRARASELLRATEHENLCPQMGEWLDSATRGLGVMAKTRIAKDIASHFFDARAAALEEGLPAPEAELRAIKTLGNPRSARRGFRKVYLTKREEAWIRKIYCPGTTRERLAKDMAPVLVVIGILIPVGLFAYGYLVYGERHEGMMMFVLLFGLLFVVGGVNTLLLDRWMQQGRPRRAKVTELIILGFVGLILVPVMLVQSIDLDTSQFYKMALAPIPFFFVCYIVLGVRTLRKLPKDLSAEERRFFKRES